MKADLIKCKFWSGNNEIEIVKPSSTIFKEFVNVDLEIKDGCLYLKGEEIEYEYYNAYTFFQHFYDVDSWKKAKKEIKKNSNLKFHPFLNYIECPLQFIKSIQKEYSGIFIDYWYNNDKSCILYLDKADLFRIPIKNKYFEKVYSNFTLIDYTKDNPEKISI